MTDATIYFDDYSESRRVFYEVLRVTNRTDRGNVTRSHGMESITFNDGTDEEFRLKFRTRTGSKS